jgi:hypothetical protein
MSTTNQIAISDVATNVINLVKTALAKSPTGVTFFSVKNYTNKFGEVSNQKINVGTNYEKMKLKDIETLQNLDITAREWKSSLVDIEIARTALIEAFISPDKVRSDAQKDAYTVISKGIKVHNTTGALYLYGYRVRKTVLVKGEYPVVNSRKETIAKDELRKLLRTNKFVNFGLEVGNELTASGRTIEL